MQVTPNLALTPADEMKALVARKRRIMSRPSGLSNIMVLAWKAPPANMVPQFFLRTVSDRTSSDQLSTVYGMSSGGAWRSTRWWSRSP